MKIKIIPSAREGLALIEKHILKSFFHFHEKNGKTGEVNYSINRRDANKGEDSTFAKISPDMLTINVYSNDIPKWIKLIALDIEKLVGAEVTVVLNRD